MVNWDDDKEQIFWIKVIIAIISAITMFFLIQNFPDLMIKTFFLNIFTISLISCLFVAFVIPPVVILVFNKLRKAKRPPLVSIFFYGTLTLILIYTTIFTILFILNVGRFV